MLKRIVLSIAAFVGLVLTTGCNVGDIIAPDPSKVQFYTAFFNPSSQDAQIAILPKGQVPIDSDFHRFDHGGGTYEAYLNERPYHIVVRKIITGEIMADEEHAPDGVMHNAHYNGLTMDACYVYGQGWQP